MPQTPPTNYGAPGNTGYGPVNFRNNAPDVFSQMDSYISYQNMVRESQVDQYYQSLNQPPDMTQHQLFRALTQGRFSQGVDPTSRENMYRQYQRRNELMRETYSAQLFSQSIGLGGMMMGIGPLGLVGAAATAPITMSIDAELRRRQFAANLSTDLDVYRRRIGGNFSYQQNSFLGRQLQQEMYRGEFTRPGQIGDFFNSQQQMSIFKTGLSTGLLDTKNSDVERMITDRGGKLDTSTLNAMRQGGTTQQFVKNFEALRDTTKDVVKLLSTTVEGALSTIKQLNQSGFKSISEIRQQVMQASTFGNLTGIGSQNMMLVGAAGAQAVQGTGWSGASGASMFQTAATVAGLQAQSSPMMARAVARAGGIGQAGASLASAEMNMLSSGMGTRVVAAMLRADGSINPEMMDRMRSGNMSAYELTSRASGVGYSMGAGGRAMFNLTRQRALESMSDMDRQMLSQKAFDAWRANKQGNAEQQAWVYAGMWTNDPVSRELMQQNLITSKQYDKMWAAKASSEGAMKAVTIPNYRNPISRGIGNTMVGIAEMSAEAGYNMVDAAGGIGRGIQNISRATRQMYFGAAEKLEAVLDENRSQYGYVSRVPNMNAGAILNAAYGVNSSLSGAQRSIISKMSSEQVMALQGGMLHGYSEKALGAIGVNVSGITSRMGSEQLQILQQKLAGFATGLLDPKLLIQSRGTSGILEGLGIAPGSDLYNTMKANPTMALKVAMGSLASIGNQITKNGGTPFIANYQNQMYDERSAAANTDAKMKAVISTFATSDYTWYSKKDNMMLHGDNPQGAAFSKLFKQFGRDTGKTVDFLSAVHGLTKFSLNPNQWSDFQNTWGGTLTSFKYGTNRDDVVKKFDPMYALAGSQIEAARIAHESQIAGSAWNLASTQSHSYADYYNQAAQAGRFGKNAPIMNSNQEQIQTLLRLGKGDELEKIFGNNWLNNSDVRAVKKELMLASGGSLDWKDSNSKSGFLKIASQALDPTMGGFSSKAQLSNTYTQLSQELAKVNNERSRVDGQWVSSKNSSHTLNQAENESIEERADKLKAQIDRLGMNTPGTPDGATAANGSGMNASVAPPVLNYWNNRWIL